TKKAPALGRKPWFPWIPSPSRYATARVSSIPINGSNPSISHSNGQEEQRPPALGRSFGELHQGKQPAKRYGPGGRTPSLDPAHGKWGEQLHPGRGTQKRYPLRIAVLLRPSGGTQPGKDQDHCHDQRGTGQGSGQKTGAPLNDAPDTKKGKPPLVLEQLPF